MYVLLEYRLLETDKYHKKEKKKKRKFKQCGRIGSARKEDRRLKY